MHPCDSLIKVGVQGGIRLLIAYLGQDSCHAELAALTLHNAVALHAPNQAAARQAGAFPALLGLLGTGPDSPSTECAARCIHALTQVTAKSTTKALTACAQQPSMLLPMSC